MKKGIYIIIFFIIGACNTGDSNLKIVEGNAIGTTFSIRYLDKSNRSFSTKIDGIIKAVNRSVSTYIPTSDISKINAGDTTIVIDEIFNEIFQKSQKIFEETGGNFDPTIGVLVNAWGFGPNSTFENLDSLKIRTLLQYVGFDKVTIRNGKIVKAFPEILFDFNAIAKGYLVDMLGRFFEDENIENYMVEIGGEIRARGVNQKNNPWRIAIENPNIDNTRSFATTIQLVNESIATSGNYRKYRTTIDGKKYVHTINPITGYAKESNLLSASVISQKDCADLDAYATAFMTMGFDETRMFLNSRSDLKVFLIYVDDNGEMQTYKSPSLEE